MTTPDPAPAGSGPLATVLALLRADAPGTVMGAPQDWPRWAQLLPHVLAAASCLDHQQAVAGPAGDDASWLLDRAATYLQVHGRPAEARHLLSGVVQAAALRCAKARKLVAGRPRTAGMSPAGVDPWPAMIAPVSQRSITA
jgi:hypothetical protein